MKIASWNVNSIKARKDHVIRYLNDNEIDVLMMQELKGVDFPEDAFEDIGYKSAFTAQKSYNGVAILSKPAIENIRAGLPGDDSDEQARYIEADIAGIRMINIYLPNGNPVGTEKFDYKLAWLDRLKKHLSGLREEKVPFIIGGDFNVIPQEEDCYNPDAWKDDALFQPESRRAFQSLLHLGLKDVFRLYHKRGGHYTFWDYQAGAWPKNHGIRIDHFLTSPAVTDKLKGCNIDTQPRGWEKPSDHTPIWVEIES